MQFNVFLKRLQIFTADAHSILKTRQKASAQHYQTRMSRTQSSLFNWLYRNFCTISFEATVRASQQSCLRRMRCK